MAPRTGSDSVWTGTRPWHCWNTARWHGAPHGRAGVPPVPAEAAPRARGRAGPCPALLPAPPPRSHWPSAPDPAFPLAQRPQPRAPIGPAPPVPRSHWPRSPPQTKAGARRGARRAALIGGARGRDSPTRPRPEAEPDNLIWNWAGRAHSCARGGAGPTRGCASRPWRARLVPTARG